MTETASPQPDHTPETARALLYQHGLPEDVIDGALCLHAQELAAQIRSVTEQLKADGVLEPDKFRPCRDAADQIDPTREGSPYEPAAVLPAPDNRAALSAKLWAVAEQHIVSEWICCEPLDPKHDLCAKGHAALGMVRTLLVDSPEAWNPGAPLLDAVLAELRRMAGESTVVPPPADRAVPELGSGEYGAAFRQRLIAVLTEEADRQGLFEREHGQMGRARIIERLATAAVGVAYPEFWVWKAAGSDRTAVLNEVAAAQDRRASSDAFNKRHVLATTRRVIATELRAQAVEEQQPETHVYLSTGCLHGDAVLPDGRTGHAYCQSNTGANGAKQPAQCKFCAAPCTCACHSTDEAQQARGIRGLLDHVGIDTTGRDITVAGKVVDEAQQQTETCRNCRNTGLDPRYNGEYVCPDCSASDAATDTGD